MSALTFAISSGLLFPIPEARYVALYQFKKQGYCLLFRNT